MEKLKQDNNSHLDRPLEIGEVQQSERFAQTERLIAQELGLILAARDAGFHFEDVHIVSTPGTPSPHIEGSSSLDLPKAIQEFKLKDYLEKRICVLCARSYAELLIVQRNKERDGLILSNDDLWQCLKKSDDYSLVCEVATLYQVQDQRNDHFSDHYHAETAHKKQIDEYTYRFGLKPLSDFLTKAEFFALLDGVVAREVRSDGCLINPSICIGARTIADYQPGKNSITLQYLEDRLPLAQNTPPSDDKSSPKNASGAIECLFAHELGHWLAAYLVGIPTSEIRLEWKPVWNRGRFSPIASGSCTVYLGSAAWTWAILRYLEARIAILCAGSLADCCMSYPGEEGIGDEYYRTLCRGTGSNDFAKMSELFLVHRVTLESDTRRTSTALAQAPDRNEILSEMVAILRRLDIWNAIKSDAYRSFVDRVISAEEERYEGHWQQDEQVTITIPTASVLRYFEQQQDLCDMVHKGKVRDMEAAIFSCPSSPS